MQTFIVKSLCAHAHTVDGQLLQGSSQFGCYVIRIHLDGHFGIVFHLIIYIDGIKNPAQLWNGKLTGCAAAKINSA